MIKTLGKKEGLAECAAIAHAHCFRAQVHLDAKRYDLAKEDARKAIEINPSSAPVPVAAWRIQADAEEASGEYGKAIDVLRKWAKANPQYATKISKEISRLQSVL